MGNINSMNMVEKLDWLSESLATAITNVAYTSWKHLSDEQKELVKVAFHKDLESNNIEVTDELIKAVKAEFTGSPMTSMLAEYISKFAKVAKQLKPEQKATVIKFDEFGFPMVLHTVIKGSLIEPYAQYSDSLVIAHKPKQRRKVWETRVLPYEELMIYDGWVDIVTDKVMHNIIKSDEHVTVKQSKYRCFDKNFLSDIKGLINQQPVIII
ncbi:hypothetical protein HFE03_07350 [Paenibacillus sp. EKM102P]|uniref:hypothetical protein n=1 Tax=unclassified Paenibacillus TaxID=185978 RepID=UPI00142E4F45|nr:MULTISPECIES: hypothetical protein [unclassified Paenibacillus]KAF6620462.1 hypothetical protein HFE00_05255 [Paenibacillus sp. EKM101P]KAF6623454.1 hypothetical protein HFE03_07350 [Paenibacillus sp. EKM102P]KAF6633984.1 hypothetical protein HFE01_07160 [Paenibacillus sp. EKM10P]KAF6649510.1 hypothetical protein HFE02_02120 [Paenibacillus sp. EKM11P]